MGKWLRRAVIVLSLAYPLALVLVAILFRYEGETWWPTGVGLYLPRIGFALPLPLLVVLLLICGMRRLLISQLVAALVLVFPLLGLVISWPGSAREGDPTLRVLSLNVDSAAFGNDKIDEQIQKFSPDIVVLQEVEREAVKLGEILHSRYNTVFISGQFMVGSRFPIMEITNPDRVLQYDWQRSARFMRYLIATPLGPVAFYNMHPISPRGAFYELRGRRGLTREILSGRLLSSAAGPDVQQNNDLRADQVQTAAEFAEKEAYPTVIAGDTNLPGLSRTFGHFLSTFQDGFTKAGFGFGYTFQSWIPWMRLDRIMASDRLRFLRFEVGCPGVSDHLCVVADIQRR